MKFCCYLCFLALLISCSGKLLSNEDLARRMCLDIASEKSVNLEINSIIVLASKKVDLHDLLVRDLEYYRAYKNDLVELIGLYDEGIGYIKDEINSGQYSFENYEDVETRHGYKLKLTKDSLKVLDLNKELTKVQGEIHEIIGGSSSIRSDSIFEVIYFIECKIDNLYRSDTVSIYISEDHSKSQFGRFQLF